jgi:hypothetical protein
VYSGTLAPSLKAACTAFSRDAQNLRPEKVELIYLRPQDIVAWTIMLNRSEIEFTADKRNRLAREAGTRQSRELRF